MAEPSVVEPSVVEPGMAIVVDHDQPVRTTDGGWKIDIWAIAQRDGRQPLSGKLIEFFVGTAKHDEATTGEDGCALPKEVTVPAGTLEIKIYAQVARNAALRSPGKVVRLGGVVSKPKEIRSYQKRVDNGFLIVALILDTNENPVQGETLFVMDPQDSRFVYDVGHVSDKHGMVQMTVSSVENRTIILRVRGIEKSVPLGVIPDFDPRNTWDSPTQTNTDAPEWEE